MNLDHQSPQLSQFICSVLMRKCGRIIPSPSHQQSFKCKYPFIAAAAPQSQPSCPHKWGTCGFPIIDAIDNMKLWIMDGLGERVRMWTFITLMYYNTHGREENRHVSRKCLVGTRSLNRQPTIIEDLYDMHRFTLYSKRHQTSYYMSERKHPQLGIAELCLLSKATTLPVSFNFSFPIFCFH